MTTRAQRKTRRTDTGTKKEQGSTTKKERQRGKEKERREATGNVG